jgi:hypothetical protein
VSLTFDPPGPVAEQFMHDRSFVSLICGPIGSGKSTAALFKLLWLALDQEPVDSIRRSRVVILRNTADQLRDTIVPTLNQWFVEAAQGRMGGWTIKDKRFLMRFALADRTTVDCEFWLMAADTPDDVRRLLSVECSWAWVEEAREVREEVFSGLQGRVGRYPSHAMGGVKDKCVLASTNPPMLGTFWHKVMTETPKDWKVFMQPSALLDDNSLNPQRENPFLDDDYYDKLIAGKTEEWVDVYLRGRFGVGNAGQPVYKSSFKRNFHIAADKLLPIKTFPLVVGMDNGLTAAAAILQQDMRGRIMMLDECYVPPGVTMGIDRYLDTMLVPLLRQKYFLCDIVFVLDPACFERTQINEETIAQAVQKRGYRVCKARTNDPEKRIGCVEQLLTRQTDGKGHFLVSPDARWCIEGFEYGYRYPAKRDGTIQTTGPMKNHHSHFHDALQYAASFYTGVAMDHKPQALPTKKVSYHYG